MRNKLYIHLTLIACISLISQYQIQSLNDINWDIALFLTPYGIVKNWFNRETQVLWQFYFDPAQLQTQLSLSQTALMISVYLCLLLSARNILKGLK